MKKRFSEEQIIRILKEQEAGGRTVEICRRHGICVNTFYKWKAKYGGMEASEARRLKELEDENRRLKRLVADLSLDKSMLQDALSKKW
jgi:putative transposase